VQAVHTLGLYAGRQAALHGLYARGGEGVMDIVRRIVKQTLLIPARIVQGAVEAVDETIRIAEGGNKVKKP